MVEAAGRGRLSANFVQPLLAVMPIAELPSNPAGADGKPVDNLLHRNRRNSIRTRMRCHPSAGMQKYQ